jgi:transcriptional regulator with XRE-family HTH domain
MSNLLKVAMIDLILSLHRQGMSQRRIASELGINRQTVARYLSQPRDAAKPANAPTDSIDAEVGLKPANAPPARLLLFRGQISICHRPLWSRRESRTRSH